MAIQPVCLLLVRRADPVLLVLAIQASRLHLAFDSRRSRAAGGLSAPSNRVRTECLEGVSGAARAGGRATDRSISADRLYCGGAEAAGGPAHAYRPKYCFRAMCRHCVDASQPFAPADVQIRYFDSCGVIGSGRAETWGDLDRSETVRAPARRRDPRSGNPSAFACSLRSFPRDGVRSRVLSQPGGCALRAGKRSGGGTSAGCSRDLEGECCQADDRAARDVSRSLRAAECGLLLGRGGDGRSITLLQGYQPLYQLRIIFLLDAVDLPVVFVHLRGIIHGAEFGAAHGAEGGFLVVIVRQGLIVHGACSFGIERERELLFPVKFVAGVAQSVVAVAGAGTSAGDVGSVRGDLVGDDAVLHVLLVG